MSEASKKITCTLIGDVARDFDRLGLELSVEEFAATRAQSHAVLISAAILLLDATKRTYAATKEKRYPSLQELLEYAGVSEKDINALLEAGGTQQSA